MVLRFLVCVSVAASVGACGSKSSSKGKDEQQTKKVVKRKPVKQAPTEPLASSRPPPVDTHAPVQEPMPLYDCPVTGDKARDPDKLLDTANAQHRARNFGPAYACATVAVDLQPRSVEAHHVRAAALAGLKRYQQAQVVFAMALALDPDDPETLAAAADFYLNVLPRKRRDTTRVAHSYAKRGSARASSRRRKDRRLRGRLALLEGQALNDLGRPDDALKRVDEALVLAPQLVQARHERGVALFNLCNFELAQVAFEQVLRVKPDDAFAHHHAGLVYARLGKPSIAAGHFRRARKLAPHDFFAPVKIGKRQFAAEVDKAIREFDGKTQKLLEGVALEITALPTKADLTATSPPFSPTILGLFRGLPKVGRGSDLTGDAPPRAIVLYRENLVRAVRTREELNRQIRRTLVHEIGHLRGMDEDELRRKGLD